MKNYYLTILFLFCTLVSNAQEQPGFVKTIGRPGQPGEPLENVMIRAQGGVNATLSDSTGNFHLTLANHKIGQAYSLSRVFRMGYQLVDDGVVGRKYPFSDDIPLEIAMVSNEVYNRTKSQIENEVRTSIEEEYQSQVDILKKQLEDKAISEEMHIRKLCDLNDYYDKTENLINKLADKYAKMDYDYLDSLDVQICSYIEQGKLEEADALIQSKGTRQALEQLKKDNLLLEISLEEGRKAEARMVEDYAADLMVRHEIASLRFDNEAAAAFLKERMELDTNRVVWGVDYALFVQEYLGCYDEAMAIYQKALLVLDNPAEIDDIYGCIGNLHHRLGQYDDALEAYNASAQVRIDNDLPVKELAKSYFNIASVLIDKDEYDLAMKYLEKARVGYDEVADSLALSSLYNLIADYALNQGKHNDALQFLEQALRIRINEYGETHQTVASIYKGLAEVSRKLVRFDDAAEYAAKAYDVFVKIYGDRHPNVASARMSMGALAMETEDFDKALEYYLNATDIFEEFYQGLHPDIATAYYRLADYYGNVKSDYAKAVSYLDKAKQLAEKIYGKYHSSVAVFVNNMAIYYARMEQYDKAAEYYKESLAIRQELFGEDHLRVAEVYVNIGVLASAQDRYDDAIEYFEKTLEIFISHYGEAHPDVATIYNNLGSVYSKINNYLKALEYLDKAKCIYIQIYGRDNSHIATVYDNMAVLYEKLKQYDKAEELALEALDIRLRIYGEHHNDTALSYNNLALLYKANGQLDKAEAFMLKSIDVTKVVYGEISVAAANGYSNLASLYIVMQKMDLALEYAHKCLDIANELFAWTHPRTILCRYTVADCYLKMKRYDDAIPYLASLFYDYIVAEGPAHNYTKRFYVDLQTAYARVMSEDDYDGRYDEDFQKLNVNSVVTVRVEENSPASEMGLTGIYYVMSYEEWALDQNDVNFFVFQPTVASRPERTYVFYRDNEFITVPVEGYMGIWFNLQWIPAEDKLEMIRKYKKWARKNR